MHPSQYSPPPNHPLPHGYNAPYPPVPMPQPRSNKTAYIILGVVGGLTALGIVAILLFVGYLSSTAQKKVETMETIASRLVVPEDWMVKYSEDPVAEPSCFSIDTACYTLSRVWDTPGYVDSVELESMMNMRFKESSLSESCRSGIEDGFKVDICVFDDNTVRLSIRDSF